MFFPKLIWKIRSNIKITKKWKQTQKPSEISSPVLYTLEWRNLPLFSRCCSVKYTGVTLLFTKWWSRKRNFNLSWLNLKSHKMISQSPFNDMVTLQQQHYCYHHRHHHHYDNWLLLKYFPHTRLYDTCFRSNITFGYQKCSR